MLLGLCMFVRATPTRQTLRLPCVTDLVSHTVTTKLLNPEPILHTETTSTQTHTPYRLSKCESRHLAARARAACVTGSL